MYRNGLERKMFTTDTRILTVNVLYHTTSHHTLQPRMARSVLKCKC